MPKIEAVQAGPVWAIKHDGGYIGYADTAEEAQALADALSAWPSPPAASHGRGRGPDPWARDQESRGLPKVVNDPEATPFDLCDVSPEAA